MKKSKALWKTRWVCAEHSGYSLIGYHSPFYGFCQILIKFTLSLPGWSLLRLINKPDIFIYI